MIKIIYTLCALDGSWCNDHSIATEFESRISCMRYSQAVLAQRHQKGTRISKFKCTATEASVQQ